MKCINLFCLGLLFCLSSCIPSQVYYLGDSYRPTSQLDVFYDALDVEDDFRSMGTMTSAPTSFLDFEPVKESMIQRAKAEGADGIVFNQIDLTPDCERTVKATLIKYK